MINEFGDTVPEEIIQKGREKGCIKCPRYIYKNGKYKKLPAASIGGKKATRFRSLASANANIVSLGDGWVAFKSPSHAGVVVNGPRSFSTSSRDSAIIGGFDGATGLWKSLEEHRNGIYSKTLKDAWDEIMTICSSFENNDLRIYSRKSGFSCIISGLKVMELKFEPPVMKLKMFKNIHNNGKRSVKQEKSTYIVGGNKPHLSLKKIRNHLEEQLSTIGHLRDTNSIGYMEKWLHTLLIEHFDHRKIAGLELDFLHYEVPLGKVKRNRQFGREHADIFARDASGSLVIIEVKENSSNIADAIRQGLSYVKWVDQHKEKLKPRIDELEWNVDLDSLKLYIIAPGLYLDQEQLKNNLGEEIKDHDVTVVLINNDWSSKKCIQLNQMFSSNQLTSTL